MNGSVVAVVLIASAALFGLGATGCARGLAADLPARDHAHAEPLAAGQVPPVALPDESMAPGTLAGPLFVQVRDAYVQHWMANQWMLHATVVLTNRSMQPQAIGPDTLSVAREFPAAVPMVALQTVTLLPRQSATAEVLWSVPFVGTVPRELLASAAGVTGVRVPVAFSMRPGNAVQVFRGAAAGTTRVSTAGAAGAQPATNAWGGAAQDPSAEPVGFFRLLRDQFRSPACEIRLGNAAAWPWYNGTLAVRVGVTVENTSRTPVEVRRTDFVASAGGAALEVVPYGVTFPERVTLAPGERAIGTLGWHVPTTAPHEITVVHGEPDSRGRRPFQQMVAFNAP